MGSGNIGIVPYLNRNITGLDNYFYKSEDKRIKIIKGDTAQIPFKDNSFDVVISMDMMEHIKPHVRKKSVQEMLRVTKKYLIIGFPTGRCAHKQDVYVVNLTKKIFGKEDPFAKEHLDFPLPMEKEFLDFLVKKYIRSVKRINNFPIRLRYIVLWLLFNNQKWKQRTYFILNIFARAISKVQSDKSYRKIFFIEKSA